jgi:hypothetical protein
LARRGDGDGERIGRGSRRQGTEVGLGSDGAGNRGQIRHPDHQSHPSAAVLRTGASVGHPHRRAHCSARVVGDQCRADIHVDNTRSMEAVAASSGQTDGGRSSMPVVASSSGQTGEGQWGGGGKY